MSKHKKRTKKQHTPAPPKASVQLEKEMKHLLDFLQKQNFNSPEEADAFLASLIGLSIDGEVFAEEDGPLTEHDEAQELVYQALEADSLLKANKLLDKALALDPDHVEALNVKAEISEDIGLAIQYYQQAVDAGRKALGEEFDEFRGHFWGFHQTRPFMRAKAGLASALYFAGRTAEAMQHHWEMLELNPNDNQGLRHELSTWLLEQNDLQGFEKLHSMYPDDGVASMQYNYALYLFKTQGETYHSEKALKKALKQNKHVPAFILGKKKLPEVLPDFMGFGDENEAIDYAENNMLLWKKTPMAVLWLKRHSRQ